MNFQTWFAGRSWRQLPATLLLSCLAPLSFDPSSASAQALLPVQAQANGQAYAPGEVLVQFKPGAADEQLADALRRAALRVRRHIHTPLMQAAGHPGLVVTVTGLPVPQALRALQNHPAVEFAEPNWIYRHQATSNDPYFTSGYLWGMYGDLTWPANPFGSQAAEAWAAGYVGSRSVCVGVIDEGVQHTHPDLSANIWINPKEIPGDGIDNDRNGYVDDVHGWDFYYRDGSVYDDPSDDHGTHVAGTIGGVGGNGFGVAGVNWNVTMVVAKFLGPNGGYTSDAVEAVDYMTNLKLRSGFNLVALNCSWSANHYSQGLHDAIIRAAKAGILLVAAAGNSGGNNDTTPRYPANYDTTQGTSTESAADYDSVIAVTAIDSGGSLASWSGYGATSVDLAAPGVGIWSTLPIDDYGSYLGTSMAAPHVTGAAALYASTHPEATAAEIKAALLASVISTPSLGNKTRTGGRLNLSTVITPGPTPPALAAPSNLTATPVSSSQVNLSWTDNSNDESGFEVERATDKGAFTVIARLGADESGFSCVGLQRNRRYYFRVRAFKADTHSAYSNTAVARTTK